MGEVQEEEPEHEAVVGPSGEATLHSSGSTPHVMFFFFRILCQNVLKKTLFSMYPSHLLPFSFLDRWIYWGGGSITLDKRGEGYQYLQSWIQVGGFPAQPEEEAWGLWVEVGLLYPLFLFFMWLFFHTATPMFPFWSFIAGVGFAEAGQLITWGGSQTRGGSPVLRNGRAS